MDRIFNLSQLHKNASSEDLKQGSFGIEWEGLRVRENGELSLSPHPEIFGNKLSNKAQIFGGIVLIFTGIKILLEHLIILK